MVWHIDDDGVLLGISLHDLCHDGVVVQGGIVIITKHLALLDVQLWSLVFITACPETSLLLAVTILVAHMLTHQVEDGEVVLAAVFRCLQLVVVVIEQTVIEGMKLGVAAIKLQLAQLWIVQEETATEVIDGFLGLWQKLVGDEGDMIACLAEQLWEERIVAPLSLLANHMGREDVLENKTRQVPTGHDIRKLGQFTGSLQSLLTWGRLHEITILLGVVSAIALADDEYDLWRAIGAGIHLDLVGGMDELGNLVRSQLVGVDAEVETIEWEVEIATILLGQGVFYLTDGLARHQFVDGDLVLPRYASTPDV